APPRMFAEHHGYLPSRRSDEDHRAPLSGQSTFQTVPPNRGGMTLDVHRPAMCPCRREPTRASTRGLIVIELTVPCWCVAAWLTFVASAPVFAQCSPNPFDEQ